MNRKTRLEDLFKKWGAATQEGLIKDGIVDEQEWENTRPKILYLMKEPNSEDDAGGWSLCDDFLSEGAVTLQGKSYAPTWGLVARWTKGITEGFLSWMSTVSDRLDYTSPSVRKPYLRRIAVVNLKKTGGTGSTPIGSLSEFANRDRVFIRDEIAIIQPDLVVCCGTGHEFREVLYTELKDSWVQARNGIPWARSVDHGWVVVDYYHPQARYPHNFLYTMLVDVIRDVWTRPNGTTVQG